MVRKGLSLGGVAGLALWLATGCTGAENSGQAPVRLSPSPLPHFADIPVPSGFKRVDERSMDLVSGSVRLVRHVYEGRADLMAVRDFYCEQMPVGRWREVNRRFEEGRFTLRFEKDNEGCEVEFRRRGGLSNMAEIQVVVMPRHVTEAPPSVKASTRR
ncbi:MAG: hypothetical protein JSU68_01995 [Phycisphaerales bacterium]|nr:MAG: hypothetical protein JSU68_01995 [Phycisphaerales bacterium]